MKTTLVNMPWARLEMPSLALGILRNRVREGSPGAEVEVLDAHLDYVDWLSSRTAEEFGLADYNYFCFDSYYQGLGDWVFSSALYDDPRWRVEEFLALHGDALEEKHRELALRLHALAPAFTDELAGRIAAARPDVVGFTTTFQQNTASLAVARKVKALLPDVTVVFGGANCDAEQGAALHENFGFVDYVVRGEGEAAFPALLAVLAEGGDAAGISGLCRRDDDGASLVNPMSAGPLGPDAISSPDFTGFYERLRTSRAARWVEPKIPVEGSRGCWWGAKHHCTFCGLNGSFMEFRSKEADRFYDELVGLAERYGMLDFVVVDNIIDMGYLSSLLPRITESGFDFRLHYEIKSNMRREQLRVLADAGVVHVQPGIENLSSRVLRIMNKGVTGCQNVRMMRDAESFAMTVDWNYLYGFPGETPADYADAMRQVPALEHLHPPAGASRIAIERFSPYFNRPELGFGALRPDRQYGLVYDLRDDQLFGMAYLFDAPKRGIDDAEGARIAAVLDGWKEAYPASSLVHWDLGDEIRIADTRRGFTWKSLSLTDPREMSVFRLLDQPRTVPALRRKLEAGPGGAVDAGSLVELLDHWLGLGLVFTDEEHFVQVTTEPANQPALRSDPGAWLTTPARVRATAA